MRPEALPVTQPRMRPSLAKPAMKQSAYVQPQFAGGPVPQAKLVFQGPLTVNGVSPVTLDFEQDIVTGLKTVQQKYPRVLETLKKQGYDVVLAEKAVDALPDLQGLQPNGRTVATSFLNTPVIHSAADRKIVVGQRFRLAGGLLPDAWVKNWMLSKNKNPKGSLNYGIAAAYADALKLTGNPALKNAMRADFQNMAMPERERFALYITNNPMAIVEGLAVHLGQGNDPGISADEFHQKMPTLMSALKSHL